MKLLFACLFSLLAFQYGACEPIVSRDVVVYGLIDTITQAIADATISLSGKIDEGITTLSTAAKTATSALNNTLVTGTGELSKIVDAQLSVINQGVKSVQELGLDPTKCLGNVIDLINSLKDSYVKDLGKCVYDRIGQVDSAVDVGINELRGLNDQLKKLAEELKACNGGFFCLSSLLPKVLQITASLPIKAVQLSATYSNLIFNISKDAVSCATGIAIKLADAVKTPTEKTVKCLAGLIGGKQ